LADTLACSHRALGGGRAQTRNPATTKSGRGRSHGGVADVIPGGVPRPDICVILSGRDQGRCGDGERLKDHIGNKAEQTAVTRCGGRHSARQGDPNCCATS
jgi:hypothetical protein